MNTKLLLATLLVVLPAVLLSAESDPKEGKAKEKKSKTDDLDAPQGYDVKEAEERAYWRRRQKLLEKQRAQEDIERKAEETAKAASSAKKSEDTTPPKDAKPETPSAPK